MLELRNVSYVVTKDGKDLNLLHETSLIAPRSHFMAIVGPSGCGKTTLLKTIAGILEESDGKLYWDGRDLTEDAELESSEVGYVPQFSVAYEYLTIEESVDSAVQLRVTTLNHRHVEKITEIVLLQTGLEDIADRRVKVLSGGQRRRLGLALELVNNPKLLLCDEVTSGLDPRSENDIVHLLHKLSQVDDRMVINVTHSLSNLELYDSILVVYEGCIVYHGPPQSINHYFSVDNTKDVYPQLAHRDARDWHESWQKHRLSYYESYGFPKSVIPEPGETPVLAIPKTNERSNDTNEDQHDNKDELQSLGDTISYSQGNVPGPWRQFSVLLARRFKIFFRDRGQFFLQLALLLGFPALVILFTPGLFDSSQQGIGIPPMPNQLTPTEIINSTNVTAEVARANEVAAKQFKLGVLLSGLVMFQVILLCLIGSNNAAREIVSERTIFEKEKLAGLSPFSYLLSKVFFLSLLCLAQSAWMTVFVRQFTGMPGSFAHQFILLFLVNASLTTICLAISAWAKSNEQASLLSVYLVGFQLPLSNAVLALPSIVALVTQPFIAAYWGWSGQLDHITKATSYDVGITMAIPTTLTGSEFCIFVLTAHVIVGLFITYLGINRHRWD